MVNSLLETRDNLRREMATRYVFSLTSFERAEVVKMYAELIDAAYPRTHNPTPPTLCFDGRPLYLSRYLADGTAVYTRNEPDVIPTPPLRTFDVYIEFPKLKEIYS